MTLQIQIIEPFDKAFRLAETLGAEMLTSAPKKFRVLKTKTLICVVHNQRFESAVICDEKSFAALKTDSRPKQWMMADSGKVAEMTTTEVTL